MRNNKLRGIRSSECREREKINIYNYKYAKKSHRMIGSHPMTKKDMHPNDNFMLFF